MAQKGIGRLIQVGIAKETSRGTPVTTPAYMIAFSELDLDEKDQRVVDEQSRGVIESSVSESIVKQWMEGSIKAPIGDQSFPLLLLSICGTATASATGSAYAHTILVAQNAQHPTITVLIDDPVAGQDYAHPNSVVGQLEIAYEQNAFIHFTAQLRGQKGTATAVTPASVTENRFLPQHLTFKVADTQADLTGTGTAISLKSATLRIGQSIQDDDVLGSSTMRDILNKQFTIEGELEAIFKNESDFKTGSLTGTAKALRFDLVNTGAPIGGSATSPSLRIDLHKIQFQPITKPIRLNDIVMQKVAFRAHYHTTDAKMVTITATNAVASY